MNRFAAFAPLRYFSAVIPAKAGTHFAVALERGTNAGCVASAKAKSKWIPAFAGMTGMAAAMKSQRNARVAGTAGIARSALAAALLCASFAASAQNVLIRNATVHSLFQMITISNSLKKRLNC